MRKLEDLNFSDDFIFWKVMTKPDLCRQVLEIILNQKIREVNFKCTPQQIIQNAYNGHGVQLDVIAEDDCGTHYNIEMQMDKKHNLRKRSRYYRGQIDLDMLHKGMDYVELPETIVIFICLFDEFKAGRCIYTFKEICEEDKEIQMCDGARTIFLNSKGDVSRAAPELRAFVEYLNNPTTAGTADFKLISSLQQEVDAVKRDSACREEFMKLELLLKERYKEGIAQGQAELCINMYKNGVSAEDIAKYTGLDLEKVQEMINQVQ